MRLTQHSVDVSEVVWHGASESSEQVGGTMGDQLPVELDVVLTKGDTQSGNVERYVQDAEED
jgi:hypothetical protein